ncbi:MAG: dipeptide epimerase [Candidatus Aureabacteria bacterium]|nr:dipeptide epimerase [Candidatus Auribacterota bacterium]
MPTALRVTRLVVYRIRLPLRIHFSHSRSVRSEAENIVVEAVTDRGVSGFGEGVPREYVTGETPDEAMRYLAGLDCSFLAPGWGTLEEGVCDLQRWECGVDRTGAVFPGAARCALGLSLLDALTRAHGVSVREVGRFMAGVPDESGRPSRVRYSAVCSGGSIAPVTSSLIQYRLYGFKSVKLKVGWDEEADAALVRRARKILGSGIDIRVDANGAWDTATALRVIPRLGESGISAVEEPLAPDWRGDYPRLRKAVGVPIMLDESVSAPADARAAMRDRSCDLVNVRISKCGGLFASHRMALALSGQGIGYALGCQVGETGLLSAAGRHLAFFLPGIRYLEGSYDRHLLKRNLTIEDPTFRYGGRARPLEGNGLGVTVNRRVLDAVTVQRQEIAI